MNYAFFVFLRVGRVIPNAPLRKAAFQPQPRRISIVDARSHPGTCPLAYARGKG
jgi:hypothetical protein